MAGPARPSAPPARAASTRRTARAELSVPDYLRKILNAQVYDVAKKTALERAAKLSRRVGNHVWLKREDTQAVFSFKLRGAYTGSPAASAILRHCAARSR